LGENRKNTSPPVKSSAPLELGMCATDNLFAASQLSTVKPGLSLKLSKGRTISEEFSLGLLASGRSLDKSCTITVYTIIYDKIHTS